MQGPTLQSLDHEYARMNVLQSSKTDVYRIFNDILSGF